MKGDRPCLESMVALDMTRARCATGRCAVRALVACESGVGRRGCELVPLLFVQANALGMLVLSRAAPALHIAPGGVWPIWLPQHSLIRLPAPDAASACCGA